MENKENIKKELEELAPIFARMEKKNPFSVPDSYFQNLPGKLLERVKQEPQPLPERMEQMLNSFFNRLFQPRYAIPFAACLVLLPVSIGLLKQKNQTAAPLLLSDIPTAEIDAYILADIDEYDMVALNDVVPAQTTAIIPQNISEEELNNFLEDNIDNQTLEEEFL